MTHQVIPFNFQGADVRLLSIDGEPWFVAKDVAELLGYSDTKKAVAAHCKAGMSLSEGGRITPLVDLHPQTVLIPERDVYRLIMRSKMPQAEAFEDWVVGEVLPSIRKTGSYESRQHVTIPQSYAEALLEAGRLAKIAEEQAAQLAIAAPKAEFVDKYVEATGLKGFRQVAKLLKANEARFREFLIDKKIMYRLGGEWMAYQNHIDAGRFEVKTGSSESGHAFNQTKFTPKGVNWIAGLWAQHKLQEGV